MVDDANEVSVDAADSLLDLYDNIEWYKSLRPFREWNERAMWAVLALFGRPVGHLDVGSGDGSMLKVSRHAGVKNVVGIECSKYARDIAATRVHIMVRDLTKPIPKLPDKFPLVTCVEVAEHIPEEGAEVLLDNVTKNVCERLIFTAAPPGQGGTGHVHLREQEYWVEKLESRGLTYQHGETVRLHEFWAYTTGPMFWLPQNVMVFKRGQSER